MSTGVSPNENVVFFNGQLVPEKDVGIPIRDRGFIYGDAVFDATRTFNGRTFKLRDHVRRLYNSLRYLRIDPGISPADMERWSLEVVNHNHPLLPAGQDMWVMQRVSRGCGRDRAGRAGMSHGAYRGPCHSLCTAGQLVSGRSQHRHSLRP